MAGSMFFVAVLAATSSITIPTLDKQRAEPLRMSAVRAYERMHAQAR